MGYTFSFLTSSVEVSPHNLHLDALVLFLSKSLPHSTYLKTPSNLLIEWCYFLNGPTTQFPILKINLRWVSQPICVTNGRHPENQTNSS